MQQMARMHGGKACAVLRRAAQTVEQSLRMAIEHGVYLSGGPFKDP